ncbi:MAG: hypothetical protein ACEQSK_14385, partial [Sphingomonadaceae bacterium]
MNLPLTTLLRRVALGLTASLAMSLAAPLALAGQTQIAQVPLLNITGTGTVKPNLMLLFDNSGSMDQTYTPDNVNDNICRGGATLASARVACAVGHPPFMSSDFNKQYYNPAIRYAVPIKSDGTFYPEQTSAATAGWTNVSGDGFGAHKADLSGSTSSGTANAINLISNFPDLKWCDPNNTSNCGTNSATYTYPDSLYTKPVSIATGPYYYTIGVAEYCTDASMTSCKSTSVGASAPAGYPIPSKVRWCSDTLLINCQAKQTGTYVYPRYSTATGATASYGTISIGASKSTASMTISSIVIAESGGNVTISNGTITASTGTNTALKQQTVASAVAAGIIARSTSNQYYACVRTPSGQPSVPPCSTFGINLTADNIVAVIAVQCSGGKSLSTCVTVNDASRSGWGFTVTRPSVTPTPVNTGVPPTALLSVSGTASSAGNLSNLKLGSSTLISTMAVAKNATATTLVSAAQVKIGTAGTIRAYVGGNSVTSICAAQPATVLCLVDTSATVNGASVSVSSYSGYTFSTTAATSSADNIPTSVAAMSAGASAPNAYTRVNIVSGQTYPKTTDRTDCVAQAGVCTYAEEMNNFANWYVYYKSRLQMMKTSVGIAFSAITANYKVGFVKLSNAGAGAGIDMKPADFTGGSRATWYTTLYNTTTSGSTPIRTAMDNVGRMFANLTPYNYAAGQEVVQFPCQQNFMILTTDGYWNGGSSANVNNNDNKEDATRFCTYARGCVDTRDQSQESIS